MDFRHIHRFVWIVYTVKFLFMCVHVCLHDHMPHVCECSWRSEGDMGFSPFVCDPLDVGPMEGQEAILSITAFLWYPRYYKLRWTTHIAEVFI